MSSIYMFKYQKGGIVNYYVLYYYLISHHFFIGMGLSPDRKRESRTLHWKFGNLIRRNIPTETNGSLEPGTAYQIRLLYYILPLKPTVCNRTGDLLNLWIQSVHLSVVTDVSVWSDFSDLGFRSTRREHLLWGTHNSL